MCPWSRPGVLVLSLAALAASACVTAPPRPPPPKDWIAHRVCDHAHCIEVIEIGEAPPHYRATAMLVPGMFQNGASFDLLPEQGISFARFLIREGVKVYLVHVRGIGGSDLPPESGLDQIVTEDLPLAFDFIRRRAGEPIIVIGQSQGSITLKAFLAGLCRCGDSYCFREEVAAARQAHVRSAGFFTGNTGMGSPDPRLRAAAELGGIFGWLIDLVFDRIDGRGLALLAFRTFGEGAFDFLNAPGLLPAEVKYELLSRSVDSTTAKIALQFADAIRNGSVRSHIPIWREPPRWQEALHAIHVPVVQTTFEADPLAPPLQTWLQDFRHIGSQKKKFKRVRGQSHEDWMADPRLHAQHWMTVQELIDLW